MALGSSRNNSNIEILNLCLGKCLYSVFSEIIEVTNNPTLERSLLHVSPRVRSEIRVR